MGTDPRKHGWLIPRLPDRRGTHHRVLEPDTAVLLVSAFSCGRLCSRAGAVGLALLGIFLPVLRAVIWIGVALAFPALRVLDSGAHCLRRALLRATSPVRSYLGRNRPWKQLLVLVMYSAVVGAIGFFRPITALIAAYGLLLLLPANVMVLAVTDSFFASLNPIALGAVILAIGWPYAVLYMAFCGRPFRC